MADEQSIASATAAAGQAQRTLQEAQQKLGDEAYQRATNSMRHEVAMKRLSVDQQIDLVRQMLSEMSLSVDQAGALQEQLIGLYGQKIEREADRIQNAYNDAMDAVGDKLDTKLNDIDKRLQDTIGPLKQQLKDLQGDARDTDRDRAEAEHNRKMFSQAGK
jgi:molybdopterin converting factor small subunit